MQVPELKFRKTPMLVVRRANCRAAHVFFDHMKANLADILTENHQNVQKMHFLAKSSRSRWVNK